ncbi:MAG: iron-containing alcohol dehydrogenase, partial [Paracoccaceae bacterium]
ILDPDLTFSVSPALTAATGVDALAHSVEAFTNINAHPLVDGYAHLGIGLAGQHLAKACSDGSNHEARAGMLLSSFYGGLCLGPVNTAAGHALAYPLGTRLGLGHGLAVALLFPLVLAFNAEAQPEKTDEILLALGLGSPGDIAGAVRAWCTSLGLTMSLEAHGASAADLRTWAEEAHAIRRLMDNNPREMSIADVEAIYRAAF